MDIFAIQKKLHYFAQARNWGQFHSPKNLTMALAAEAAELLEIFQWLTEEQSKNITESEKRNRRDASRIITNTSVFSANC